MWLKFSEAKVKIRGNMGLILQGHTGLGLLEWNIRQCTYSQLVPKSRVILLNITYVCTIGSDI